MMYLTLRQLLLWSLQVIGDSAAETKRKKQEHWHSIDWEKANRIVKSLQRRIVAAVQSNRWGKVKALQWLLTHSYSAKVLAIRRVTENTGSRTSGVDGQIWDGPQAKMKAIGQLKTKGYKAKALRRVCLRKPNGKKRLLGIPTMRDRAMQALYLQALEPISETLADHHSYGFRPYRNCHDAIGQCFTLLSKKTAPQYILEGDIRSCFDKINHNYILEHIPLDKRVVQQWLKAGIIEKGKWYPTTEGTPQGSIISPTIANRVLDGMAQAIDQAMNIRTHVYKKGAQAGQRKRMNNPHKVHFVRYADDWIVCASDKTVLEQTIKPAIQTFLQQRGLELAEEKTSITTIYEGFDFLGLHLRKYNNHKLIIKPSKKSVKKLLGKIRQTIKKMKAVPSYVLITHLNRMTKGWAMYYRFYCAKQTFQFIDYHIWKAIWKWSVRRHPKKSSKWVAKKYFISYQGYRWTFFGKDDKRRYYLFRLSTVPIRRHVKIKATANPFTKEDEPIFERHIQRKMLHTLRNRQKLITIFRRQAGKCPICQQHITKQTAWHLHHIIERYNGGKDTLDNLILLHPDCHYQLHYWDKRLDGDVLQRAFGQA